MNDLKERVVLLHGIARTSRILRTLEAALLRAGYAVQNLDYPSTDYTLQELAEWVGKNILIDQHMTHSLHFVGHSMGALLIRLLLCDQRPLHLGRVVMLAPPNHGSEVADFLQRFSLFRRWLGPAITQIGTGEHSICTSLPPADYECGVIAGNCSIEPWFSWFLLKGPNDGKVLVESTKLEGMKDFIVVPVSHAAMPANQAVIRLVQRFLANACF